MIDSLIVFLPLVASVIAGLIAFTPVDDKTKQARLDAAAQWVTCGALVLSMILAVIVFIDVALGDNPRTVELFTWIDSGTLEVSWALKVDSLTAVMMIVVTVVSAMVHIYSIGYMHHDPSIPRFMSFLSLFTFFMLMLITADNLVQLFFGWEGVGLASYLLIGFWYDRPSANAAAIKAFIVNRVGDFGFALGIFAVFVLFQTVHLDTIFAAAGSKADATLVVFGSEFHALTVICILLFIGAMGKSAQLGLHTWLPDAMEGPTPVSALIHAATMVAAGVFLVARVFPLFEASSAVLNTVALVGGITALTAAVLGLAATDIKRVLAFSTVSQLGYMFIALGVGAPGVALFHLFNHAFFKCLLFLSAGSVHHSVGTFDMRYMGGLRAWMPVTYGLTVIAGLSLAGIFPFSGFWSKDEVLTAAWTMDPAASAAAVHGSRCGSCAVRALFT